ncbi:Dihydropteroate synthase [Fulvivirga imtechensis AK7]|uniref:Dihydropteroate synthase n=1 Tax=Fulvivirga imtechensis AK7 TaxID=1237149 RepID=L8JNM0_9BACT|nr:dihydropteroate synthase [Fulvivirga imtechensis]ELR69748.1 Dihydropteroate synthase [Fulvivirga imtechensis AK7]
MAKDTAFSGKKTLNIGGNVVSLERPLIIGILNVTPDSFYDGGRYQQEKDVVDRARSMIEEGADIIDIGGYSSRPGADDVPVYEELKRVVNHIQNIRKELPVVKVSIDTFRSQVAEAAVTAGANMINDISGGELDKHMYDVVADTQVPYILMHMRGTPQTMKHQTDYDDLLSEIFRFFEKKVSKLRKRDVKDIVLDPGFGFSKTMDQNYALLKNLRYFKALELPVLAGISRKSFIYRKLGLEPADALNGTTVLNTIALMHGAQILRVHDVKEAVQAVQLYNLTFNT